VKQLLRLATEQVNRELATGLRVRTDPYSVRDEMLAVDKLGARLDALLTEEAE